MILANLLAAKRIPSPLILEGTHCSASILEIAGFSLCENRSFCRQCRSCKQVLKGFHPDWISLRGSLKIEDLRAHLFQLRQKPFQSTLKVFSYDEAHESNVFVQNALLKTFEEPLSHWILVLGVNSKLSLLPTIRSRCLFYKIPESESDIELSPEEEKIFKFIEEANEIHIQPALEVILKDRQKTKSLFRNLLLKASQRRQPGHWEKLSPYLEETLPEIARNLNPRLVWDRAWARSQTTYL